jgi:hypothetical protein
MYFDDSKGGLALKSRLHELTATLCRPLATPRRSSAAVHRGACAVALAGVVTVAAAPGAGAATVGLDRTCYVSTAIGAGVTIQVTGSGFTPGEAVFAQIPAPAGLLSFVETTVGPTGELAATLTKVLPPGIEPVVEAEKMQIKGVLSGAILAEAPFELTNLGVKLNPPSASPRAKVSYELAGFTPGKPIYGHYLHKGRVALTYRFGVASGPCGVLRTKARLYPGTSRFSSYQVQFDDSKRYSPRTSPKVNAGVNIIAF